jgi:hypothetical protein
MVRFLRVVAAVAALFCFLTWGAGAADKFVYSGGKWKRASKAAKDKSAAAPEKDGKHQDAGQEPKKERTITICIPEEYLRPQKATKEQ